MLDVAVTATPLDGHWQLTAPDGRSSHCETLRQAPKIARRLAGPDVEPDVQVSLGGLEDLCADAVELGEQSDAKSVEAIRLRRITARALNAAGIAAADIGYLMGLRRESAKHLLSGPIDSLWMAAGHAPPLGRPPASTVVTTSGNRRFVVVVVTRHEGRWQVQLDDGPQVRASLAYAERFVRELIDDPDADVLLIPQLPDELESALRASDVASAEDENLRARAYGLRTDMVLRLRAVGIGVRDIGDLLGIHEHRVRPLLASKRDTT